MTDTEFDYMNNLPLEIVLKVLSYLDWRTLVRCFSVCKSWNSLIQSTTELQYIIELGADGLVNGPTEAAPTSTSARLSLLLGRRKAWRRLNFARRVSVPTPGECHAYELVAGVFAKTMHLDGGSGARHLTLARLPRSSVGPKQNGLEDNGNVRVVDDVGVCCKDFAIDPTQDLIVYVEQPSRINAAPTVSIHLRTISKNSGHPHATFPILSKELSDVFESAIIQIADDVIALLLLVHGIPRVLIWKWTTGQLLVCEDNKATFRFCDDFSLISSRAFMVTNRYPRGALKIYLFDNSLSSEQTSQDDFEYFRLQPLDRCITLLLPNLADHNSYTEITSHTAPFVSRIPDGKPFFTAEDARLHILGIATAPNLGRRGQLFPHSPGAVLNPPNLPAAYINLDEDLEPHPPQIHEHGYFDVNMEEVEDANYGVNVGAGTAHIAPLIPQIDQPHVANYIVALTNTGLMKYVANFVKNRRRGKMVVSWEEWGPQHTRWFQDRHSYAWLRYVHGLRFIRAKHTSWPSTRCKMHVLDFGVHPHRLGDNDNDRAEADAAEPDVSCVHKYVDGPSVIRDRAVFAEDVVSMLAYREVTTKDEYPYSGFMIDDECVVGLSAMAFANGDMRQIDVFCL